jgi:hypothetical protein
MTSTRKNPICSTVALVMIVVYAAVVAASILLLVHKAPLVMLTIDVFGGILLCALGMLFALVSLIRRERYIALTLLALSLNCVPLVWIWVNRSTQIIGP